LDGIPDLLSPVVGPEWNSRACAYDFASGSYFTDLLTRLVNGWPQKRIDELMPWHWVPQQSD